MSTRPLTSADAGAVVSLLLLRLHQLLPFSRLRHLSSCSALAPPEGKTQVLGRVCYNEHGECVGVTTAVVFCVTVVCLPAVLQRKIHTVLQHIFVPYGLLGLILRQASLCGARVSQRITWKDLCIAWHVPS